MLKPEDNALLTLVTGDAPMGAWMRQNFWIPAALSEKLESNEAPLRVKLFGERFIAFRTVDGHVGFFDEACPHRGASLALARQEDNALRCLFHGWKFHVKGEVLEVPTQTNDANAFCKTVPLKHYPAREGGGIERRTEARTRQERAAGENGSKRRLIIKKGEPGRASKS